MSGRRFPPPWHAEQMQGGYKIVDATGATLCCVYARDDLAHLTGGAHYLSSEEARRLALAIARLPELLKRSR